MEGPSRRISDQPKGYSYPAWLTAFGILKRIERADDGCVIYLRDGTKQLVMGEVCGDGEKRKMTIGDMCLKLVNGRVLGIAKDGGFPKQGSGFSGSKVDGIGDEVNEAIKSLQKKWEDGLYLGQFDGLDQFVVSRMGLFFIEENIELRDGVSFAVLIDREARNVGNIFSANLWCANAEKNIIEKIMGNLSPYFEHNDQEKLEKWVFEFVREVSRLLDGLENVATW